MQARMYIAGSYVAIIGLFPALQLVVWYFGVVLAGVTAVDYFTCSLDVNC
jgi:hypothetical protein